MANKRSIFVLGTIGLLVYLLLPRVTAYIYRFNTDPIEIESKRKEYHELVNLKDISVTRSDAVRKRRNEIILWMHVRDFQIDEGHEGLTLLEEWNELFEYWKLESKE